MERHEYFETLAKRLTYYYDVSQGLDYHGLNFDIYAHFYLHNERYVLTKKAVIYRSEQNQHLFIKYFKNLEIIELNQMIETGIAAVSDYVKPKDDHMATLLVMVMIVDKLPSDDVVEKIKKFKFYKSFLFGFHGWVDIGLLVVDYKSFNMIYNKKGKEVKASFVW